MILQDKKILVTGHDDFRLSRDGSGEDEVIIGIAADRLGQRLSLDRCHAFTVGHKERHYGRFNSNFMKELFGKFFQQTPRTTKLVRLKVFAHQLAAQSWGQYGGEENIRVGHQLHEMILNTSSSV